MNGSTGARSPPLIPRVGNSTPRPFSPTSKQLPPPSSRPVKSLGSTSSPLLKRYGSSERFTTSGGYSSPGETNHQHEHGTLEEHPERLLFADGDVSKQLSFSLDSLNKVNGSIPSADMASPRSSDGKNAYFYNLKDLGGENENVGLIDLCSWRYLRIRALIC